MICLSPSPDSPAGEAVWGCFKWWGGVKRFKKQINGKQTWYYRGLKPNSCGKIPEMIVNLNPGNPDLRDTGDVGAVICRSILTRTGPTPLRSRARRVKLIATVRERRCQVEKDPSEHLPSSSLLNDDVVVWQVIATLKHPEDLR